jgi:hypothetical protein
MRALYVAMLLLQYRAFCFVLPSYKIDLEDHDEFVVAGDIAISDDELEMLNEHDTHSLNLDLDDSKLEPLYRLLKRRKIQGSDEQKIKLPTRERISKKIQRPYLNREDNALNYIIQDRNADELSQKGNSQEEPEDYDEGRLETILKTNTSEQPKEYDYESLRSDYDHEVQEALHSNESFNYATSSSEETAGETSEESPHFQKPENGGKEAGSNFVMKFIIWVLGSIKWYKKMDTMEILNALTVLASLCLLIGIACWCRHGICCCCCRCSFCWPRRLMNKAKEYSAINPPGVYFENGVKKRYQPTEYEKQAYSELRKAILSL